MYVKFASRLYHHRQRIVEEARTTTWLCLSKLPHYIFVVQVSFYSFLDDRVLDLLVFINYIFNLRDDLFKGPFCESSSHFKVFQFRRCFYLICLVHELLKVDLLNSFDIKSSQSGSCQISIRFVFNPSCYSLKVLSGNFRKYSVNY